MPAPTSAATEASPRNDAVTNVQHAGVDEGDIVKVSGDYLVILRRGRLFTVRIGGGELRPVAAENAFGPGIDPRGAWYDELLVSRDLVAVIGYSYARGGTEVGLFRVGADGSLAHRATYQIRSGDYYSSRNFATRLVDGKLVFYSPVDVNTLADDPRAWFPAMRRWGGADTLFHPTVTARRVYRPAGDLGVGERLVLHTVTVCKADEDLSCTATALYGPSGRVFYVSPTAVYVWSTRYPAWYERGDGAVRSILYRLPLDGSAPTGIRVAGAPVDQLSFLESGDGRLNVLVRSQGRGDAMWNGERGDGALALLRLPLRALGDGSASAPATAYRALPTPRGGDFQNRYVGEWLLYGMGSSYGQPEGRALYAVRWAGAGTAQVLPLPHGVERIEEMAPGALAVGAMDRDLAFTAVRLGDTASLADRYVRPGAAQGESRTHGFFYHPETAETGVLGLPVRTVDETRYAYLYHGSASVLFLRNESLRLAELGALPASENNGYDDACVTSCVDWYGNARPLFLRGRVFALLGYELVEGQLSDGRIRELRRVSFAPQVPQATGQ
jgi:hypothetical protein